MARINYERMKKRNEEIQKLIDEARGLDVRKDSSRVFFCIRQASILIELQKEEMKCLEHNRLTDADNQEVRKIVAGYYSCLIQRDNLVRSL